MEFKHTPAPWHLRDGVIKNSLLINDNYNVIFASLDDIKKEDADLIAAAPELLVALINLTEYTDAYFEKGDEIPASLIKAKSVIKKALGEEK